MKYQPRNTRPVTAVQATKENQDLVLSWSTDDCPIRAVGAMTGDGEWHLYYFEVGKGNGSIRTRSDDWIVHGSGEMGVTVQTDYAFNLEYEPLTGTTAE